MSGEMDKDDVQGMLSNARAETELMRQRRDHFKLLAETYEADAVDGWAQANKEHDDLAEARMKLKVAEADRDLWRESSWAASKRACEAEEKIAMLESRWETTTVQALKARIAAALDELEDWPHFNDCGVHSKFLCRCTCYQVTLRAILSGDTS